MYDSPVYVMTEKKGGNFRKLFCHATPSDRYRCVSQTFGCFTGTSASSNRIHVCASRYDFPLSALAREQN